MIKSLPIQDVENCREASCTLGSDAKLLGTRDQRIRGLDRRTCPGVGLMASEAVKMLKPGPRQVSGLAIGRLFRKLLHRAKPEPIAVIDGTEVSA